jgi:hypothetical protein
MGASVVASLRSVFLANGLVLPALARCWHPSGMQIALGSRVQGQLTHSSPGSDLVSGNQPGRVGLGTSKEREDLTDARASTY